MQRQHNHSLHSHNHTHLHRTLQHRLSAVWSHHAIAGANNVTLIDASHGILHNKQCSTPSLFIWIAGHYRTFAWTQHHLAAVAGASSSCAFVAAFMPDEVDAEKEYSTPGAFGRVDGHKLRNALNATSISSLLRHAAATTFAKRNLPFAFAIVQRHGSVARYPGALCLGWHGVYVLTSWAAQAHSLHLGDSAVVVRTRPDVLLTRPMQIDGLMKYFAEGGEMARHVALGNYVKNYKGANDAQSDVHAIFSLGAYESGVVRPLELSGEKTQPGWLAKLWWQRAYANGWAYGRSIDEWMGWELSRPLGCPDVGLCTPSAAAADGGEGSSREGRPAAELFFNQSAAPSPMRRCMDRCLCLDPPSASSSVAATTQASTHHCKRKSCLLTVAEPSQVVRTTACSTTAASRHAFALSNGRQAYFALENMTSAAAGAASTDLPPCVLRGPPQQLPTSRQIPLLGRPFNLAESVICYCPASTSNISAMRHGTLTCSGKPHGDFGACSTSSVEPVAFGLKPRNSFWRCTRGVPLSSSSSSVWPDGCGNAFLGNEHHHSHLHTTVPVSACQLA